VDILTDIPPMGLGAANLTAVQRHRLKAEVVQRHGDRCSRCVRALESGTSKTLPSE
jgi:hypothetical protein